MAPTRHLGECTDYESTHRLRLPQPRASKNSVGERAKDRSLSVFRMLTKKLRRLASGTPKFIALSLKMRVV
eukprot:3584428-Alexandrium_andersonii.AAC.1